jgi:hypothetical protein
LGVSAKGDDAVTVVLKLACFLAIVIALLVYFTPRSSQEPTAAAPPPAAAVSLAERAQVEQQVAERTRLVAMEAAGRGAFPDRMERRFRDEFRTVTFGVSGENNTVLTMRQPQTAAAFAYKVGPWVDFLEACRAAGFRQVVVVDGSRSTRTFDLTTPVNPRPSPSPERRSTG